MRVLRLILCLMALVFCSGCFTNWVHIQSEWPLIPVETVQESRQVHFVEWPGKFTETGKVAEGEMPQLLDAAVEREVYIKTLEGMIDKYNEHAEIHNEGVYKSLPRPRSIWPIWSRE